MIDQLVIDKSSMDINCFLQSIMILKNNGGRISRYQFERQMDIHQHGKSALPAIEPVGFRNPIRTQYNKSKLPRYFGFIRLARDANNTRPDLVLTRRGNILADYIVTEQDVLTGLNTCSINHNKNEDFIRLIFESILYDSFGKNNDGVETSNTDVELPKIILKSILSLGSITAAESLYIADGMNRGWFESFDDAISNLEMMRLSPKYDIEMDSKIEELGRTNFVEDSKHIDFFTHEDLGILEKYDEGNATKYKIRDRIFELFKNELQQLIPVYKPIQMIISGVPGTGKSHYVDRCMLGGVSNSNNIIRTTIHPEYTYSDFVGFIKPVNKDGKIQYQFSPGPLAVALEKCFKNTKDSIYLVIEEMNRGDFASIMGDTFQLLDRIDDFTSNKHGWSQYNIQNKDLFKHLSTSVNVSGILPENKVSFPSNLHIVGTMNTADQNVFVLDTAFRRRFRNMYLRINFDDASVDGTYLKQIDESSFVNVFDGKYTWSQFAIRVNQMIDEINKNIYSISEDKKLAPYFVDIDDVSSKQAFCDKVVYYLKNDVFKYVDGFLTESYEQLHLQIVDRVIPENPYEVLFGG